VIFVEVNELVDHASVAVFKPLLSNCMGIYVRKYYESSRKQSGPGVCGRPTLSRSAPFDPTSPRSKVYLTSCKSTWCFYKITRIGLEIAKYGVGKLLSKLEIQSTGDIYQLLRPHSKLYSVFCSYIPLLLNSANPFSIKLIPVLLEIPGSCIFQSDDEKSNSESQVSNEVLTSLTAQGFRGIF
jgi:hypothetical protein